MDHQDNTFQHTGVEKEKSPSEKRDLDRWAKLIAEGEVPFPTELSSLTQEMLAKKISQNRRHRLLRFIARAIAMDIHRSREP